MEDSNVTEDGSKDPGKEQEKPGPLLLEKKTLIVAGIAIALFLIAVIAVFVIALSSADKGTAQPAVIHDFTQPEKGESSAQTTNVSNTVLPAVTQMINETPAIQVTLAEPVDFILQSGVPESCGFTCRQLDAMLTNSGYMTAHNVCITVSMHNSRNEIIFLNGAPTLNRCVGDIAGGQTITEPITINADCGVFASKCIGETLTLQTLVQSDENTVRFPDQIIPV
ncbi:MAG TPA: hypothetical protein VMW77_00530 [Methanoregula sp.]|nr:hypothetical protein [Methanoregula sp.]